VFGSAMLKSRSSDSFQSQLKDFIRPISLNINTCGQVIIRKVTDPAGATVSFNYSKTFATSPVTANTFSLTGAAPNDVRTFTGALPGAGSVTEDLATLPGAWQFVGLDCSASVGVVVTVVGETASWTLDAPTDVVDCTYTNRLRQGAIIVTKTRKHAADGPGPHPHAGVTFSVDGTTKTGATGTDGTVCFDGLTWSGTGTSYNVTETLPGGYSADGALTKAVLVDHNATCAGGGGNTVSFGNTPLTDVTLSVDSAVDGGTATTFTCDNGASGSTGTNGDVTNAVVANDTEPATIICTIVVDP
jgi:hypothetical protein